MFMKKSLGETVFDSINTLLMLVVMLVTLYPFWYAIIGSFNEGFDYGLGGVSLLTRKFTLDNYKVVFNDKQIFNAFKVTILRTCIGTFVHLLVTSLFAYAFSKRDLVGKNLYATLGFIAMYFSGGLIPTYLVLNSLKLVDSFWVYILPPAFSFYQVLIFQAFFRGLPDALSESAKMDGAGEYTVFFRIILPLSGSVFAAVALFNGVFHWNTYFDSLVFTTKRELQVLQLFLVRIIQSKDEAGQLSELASISGSVDNTVTSETVQLATMVAATVPIILVYPFLQRYFVKGIMIGSVKG